MRKRLFLSILILSFQLLVAGTTILKNDKVKSALTLYETWLNAQMEYRGIPGCSFAIIYDQDLVYSNGYGFSDLEKQIPASPETVYRIASITKTFTSTAILQLRDEGKLQLNDPVIKYLPWFEIRNNFEDYPEITIWHLLTHTSGLPGEAAYPYWTDHIFPTVEQIKEALPNQETIYPCETKWNYSNLAMSLLGYVVEEASGNKYAKYIEKNILQPLGMKNSSVNISKNKKLLKRLATAYGRRLPDSNHKFMPFTDSKGLTPAANMSSTVEDLAKWASFQFSGNNAEGIKLMRMSTLREMQRVQWLRQDWQSGWGLGWGVRKKGERTIVGHGGWVAGYRTQISFCPDEKIAFIVMTNSDDADPGTFVYKAFEIIAPTILNAVKSTSDEPVVPSAEWQKYIGKYRDPWLFDYDVMILNNKLVIYSYEYPPEENPKHQLSELTPIGLHTFRIADDNGHGVKVIFEFDEQGKVTRFKKGENYNYRVEDK